MLVVHALSLELYNLEPFVANTGTFLIKALQICAFQKLLKNILLKRLHYSKLTSSLYLKAFYFCYSIFEVENTVSLFEVLVLFFCSRNDHGLVWTINLKEYGHLCSGWVLLGLLINKGLELRVFESGMNEPVHKTTGKGERMTLSILQFDLKVLWEAFWQEGPNTICIKLKWLSQLVHHLSRLLDYLCSCVGHHGCHLHWVPPGSFLHDVAIEGVQYDFMSQL